MALICLIARTYSYKAMTGTGAVNCGTQGHVPTYTLTQQLHPWNSWRQGGK